MGAHERKKMFIERKVKRDHTGAIVDMYYVAGEDRFEVEDLIIRVDGKRVAADIVRLDNVEGWVDVELPEVEGEKLVKMDSKILIDVNEQGALDPNVSFFTPKVKRLTGLVQVYKKQNT
jgi:hypothetical protein